MKQKAEVTLTICQGEGCTNVVTSRRGAERRYCGRKCSGVASGVAKKVKNKTRPYRIIDLTSVVNLGNLGEEFHGFM